MKKILVITLMILSVLSLNAQDYKTKRNTYITAGTVSAVVFAATAYGAWIMDLPAFDSTEYRADPTYKWRQERDFNSALQTRRELRYINIASGVAMVGFYATAYVCHKKHRKQPRLSGMILPNGINVTYVF